MFRVAKVVVVTPSMSGGFFIPMLADKEARSMIAGLVHYFCYNSVDCFFKVTFYWVSKVQLYQRILYVKEVALSNPFYTVTYYIKWDTTSWTDS